VLPRAFFKSSLLQNDSPILITLTAKALNQENEPNLSNFHENCDDFRRLMNERLTLNIPIKIEEDIELGANFFNDTIQCGAWNATPEYKRILKAYNCPIIIK
jgi:hypothetical protein